MIIIEDKKFIGKCKNCDWRHGDEIFPVNVG